MFPKELEEFVTHQEWTFAKTYAATWPHEYIVREDVDESLFLMLVRHIREHGYEGKFYARSFTYFDAGGMVYWTMGAPIDETDIVNRCRQDQTYAYRREHGSLPDA